MSGVDVGICGRSTKPAALASTLNLGTADAVSVVILGLGGKDSYGSNMNPIISEDVIPLALSKNHFCFATIWSFTLSYVAFGMIFFWTNLSFRLYGLPAMIFLE